MKKLLKRLFSRKKYIYGYDYDKNSDTTLVSKCYIDEEGKIHIVKSFRIAGD